MKAIFKKSIIRIVLAAMMIAVLSVGTVCSATDPDYDGDTIWIYGPDTYDLTAQIAGDCIGYTTADTYALYDGIDFGAGSDYYAFRILASAPYGCKGVLELRLGDMEGELIGSMEYKAEKTGNWNDYYEYAIVIDKPELLKDVVDICLVFRPESTYLFNYTEFWFDKGEVEEVVVEEEKVAPNIEDLTFNGTVSVSAIDISDDFTVQIAGDCIGFTVPDSYGVYNWVFFGDGYEDATFYMTASAPNDQGGVVEVRAGSVEGELITTLEIIPTGDWGIYTEQSAVVENTAPLKGLIDICLVFRPIEGAAYTCNYTDFRFEGTPAESSAEEVVVEETVIKAPVAEEILEKETVVEEAGEAPVVEVPVVEEAETVPTVVAPQTFDFGIIAAISAIISMIGYALIRKQ